MSYNGATIHDHFEQVIEKYLGERMKTDEELCKTVWSSLANVEWYYVKYRDELLRCAYSFRGAGSLISKIIDKGNYMDWYCSGHVATVNDEFRLIMKKEGFIADDVGLICGEPGCLKPATCGYLTKDGGYLSTCSEHQE